MPADRVILHVGLHKTGSSVVQYTLGHSPEIINPRHLTFIRLRQIHDDLVAPLTALWDDPADPAPLLPAMDTLRGYVRESHAPDLLISYEGLLGRPAEGYPAAEIAITLLARAFEGLRVDVVMDVKRQDLFIESLYMQRVQMGQEDRPFDDWFADAFAEGAALQRFDWLALATAIERTFGTGRLRARPFRLPEIGAEAHVTRFLRDIGHEPAAPIRVPNNTNQSYSAKALQIAQAVNHLLDDTERHDLRVFLRKRFPTPEYPRPALMDDQTRARIVGHHRATNTELTARFMRGDDARSTWHLAGA